MAKLGLCKGRIFYDTSDKLAISNGAIINTITEEGAGGGGDSSAGAYMVLSRRRGRGGAGNVSTQSKRNPWLRKKRVP